MSEGTTAALNWWDPLVLALAVMTLMIVSYCYSWYRRSGESTTNLGESDDEIAYYSILTVSSQMPILKCLVATGELINLRKSLNLSASLAIETLTHSSQYLCSPYLITKLYHALTGTYGQAIEQNLRLGENLSELSIRTIAGENTNGPI